MAEAGEGSDKDQQGYEGEGFPRPTSFHALPFNPFAQKKPEITSILPKTDKNTATGEKPSGFSAWDVVFDSDYEASDFDASDEEDENSWGSSKFLRQCGAIPMLTNPPSWGFEYENAKSEEIVGEGSQRRKESGASSEETVSSKITGFVSKAISNTWEYLRGTPLKQTDQKRPKFGRPELERLVQNKQAFYKSADHLHSVRLPNTANAEGRNGKVTSQEGSTAGKTADNEPEDVLNFFLTMVKYYHIRTKDLQLLEAQIQSATKYRNQWRCEEPPSKDSTFADLPFVDTSTRMIRPKTVVEEPSEKLQTIQILNRCLMEMVQWVHVLKFEQRALERRQRKLKDLLGTRFVAAKASQLDHKGVDEVNLTLDSLRTILKSKSEEDFLFFLRIMRKSEDVQFVSWGEVDRAFELK